MIDPWGEVLAAAPEMGEQVLVADISREMVRRRRQQMPVLDMRRPEVYASLVEPLHVRPVPAPAV
jgi:predicted amidohydrolase